MRFIPPAQPALRSAPPRGSQWLHEVKFDGWRIQLHKDARGPGVLTKKGHDYARLFKLIAASIASLPAKSVIIDGELAACDERGIPDFRALHFRDMPDADLCVWAFDLLYLDGEDLRARPLMERKHALEKLVYRARDNRLRLSESFDDGLKLLVAAERMRLEGIVSKRRNAPYLSGRMCDWIKVKCPTWRVINSERWRLFEPRPK
jgi:bifunctional non-homologous end joining protein LigD